MSFQRSSEKIERQSRPP